MPNTNRLIAYHTIQANPRHFWTNLEVAKKLKDQSIKTYSEYKILCARHGVSPYNEEAFNEYYLETL